jgi:2-hydroxy-6-oxonona-2,4-dienedioate hydrolase
MMMRPRTRWLFGAAALLGVGMALAIGTAYRRDIAAARERIAVGSSIATTRCGRIEYVRRGKGPAVLVVHGAGGGFDQGAGLAEALGARGFTAITMSRFGYLRTPMPADASAQAQADAHACLLDALGIERAAIMGISAGGPSSMQFALRHPDRTSALVLLAPATYAPRPGNEPPLKTPSGTEMLFETALRWDFLMWAATRSMPRTMVRAILATPPEVLDQATREERARASGLLDDILPVSPRRLGMLNDARVTSSLPRYDLERIAAPTLIISAQDDLFGTYDGSAYSARHIPGSRFIGFPSGGHVWLGHHQQVVDEIGRFLAQSR